LVPLKQGLEGTLADLRWKAMLGMEGEVMKPVSAEDVIEGKSSAMVSSQLWLPSL